MISAVFDSTYDSIENIAALVFYHFIGRKSCN
jgi:hypothetical protein